MRRPARASDPSSPGHRLGLRAPEMRARLEALGREFDHRFLDSDPVGIVRRFDREEDREIVGLLAAGLAYGRVESIRRSLERVLASIGTAPSRFVDSFDPKRDGARLRAFAHRFTRGRDVAALLWRVRLARERSGSLESFFLEGDEAPQAETLETAMNRFGERLFDGESGRSARHAGARWLVPVPRDGSACKRHCLFLRWMVRPDDGVDCGVWSRVSRARLVVPLDVHLQRLARALGWSRRRTPGWAMAQEVTACLRRLDPDDPTKYDFALSRLGILGRVRANDARLRLSEISEVLDDVASHAG